jgi:hypothetical protein
MAFLTVLEPSSFNLFSFTIPSLFFLLFSPSLSVFPISAISCHVGGGSLQLSPATHHCRRRHRTNHMKQNRIGLVFRLFLIRRCQATDGRHRRTEKICQGKKSPNEHVLAWVHDLLRRVGKSVFEPDLGERWRFFSCCVTEKADVEQVDGLE